MHDVQRDRTPGVHSSTRAAATGFEFPTGEIERWSYAPETPTHVVGTFAIDGDLDAAALEVALGAVIQRHESLRTSFREVDARPVRAVAPAASLAIPVVDLEGLGDDQRAEELRQHVAEEARRPFRLDQAPLLRAVVYRLSTYHDALQLVLHQAVADSRSLEILVEELAECYGAVVRGERLELPDLEARHAEHVAAEREWLESEEAARGLHFWAGELDGAEPLRLPADRPRPAVQSFRGARAERRLPVEVADGVDAVAAAGGTEASTVLLAAYTALLGRLTRRAEVSVGVPASGRTPEVERAIGPFANLVVVRARVESGASFRGHLASLGEVLARACEHGRIPFEKVVEHVRPDRDLSRPPLFQTTFEHDDRIAYGLELGPARIRPLPLDPGIAMFDAGLAVSRCEDGSLAARLDYCTDLLELASAARLLERFEGLLAAAVANPDLALGELPLLTEDEHERLSGWAEGPSLPLPDGPPGRPARRALRQREEAVR